MIVSSISAKQAFDRLACIFTQAFFPLPIVMYKILLIYTLYDTMNGASFAYPVLLMYTTFFLSFCILTPFPSLSIL